MGFERLIGRKRPLPTALSSTLIAPLTKSRLSRPLYTKKTKWTEQKKKRKTENQLSLSLPYRVRGVVSCITSSQFFCFCFFVLPLELWLDNSSEDYRRSVYIASMLLAEFHGEVGQPKAWKRHRGKRHGNDSVTVGPVPGFPVNCTSQQLIDLAVIVTDLISLAQSILLKKTKLTTIRGILMMVETREKGISFLNDVPSPWSWSSYCGNVFI